MDNTLEKTTKYSDKQMPEGVLGAAKQLGTKAASITTDYAGRAAEYTEKSVKKYPLAAVGIALGTGVVLGTLGTLLFQPKPPTMMDRINDMKLGRQFRKLISRYI